MNLKINGKDIRFQNEFNVTLKYDSIASTFSFNVYFDATNPDHKNIFKPLEYNRVEIFHDNELLLTGTVLIHNFQDDANSQLIPISGYSLPGILDDCEIPVQNYPLQSLNMSLEQISNKLIKPFNLKVKVDPSVQSKMQKVFSSSTADEKQSIKAYLCSKASQKNIVLTHTPSGELFFTEANTQQIPIFEFSKSIPGVEMSISINAQAMHSEITVLKQADDEGGNAGQVTIKNPFVSAFRPHVRTQSSGSDIDVNDTARAILSEELKAIMLSIKLERWDISGKIIRPNSIISVLNPDLYLYKKTNFFVESVSLTGNEKEMTATMECFIPEVYNSKPVNNIFK